MGVNWTAQAYVLINVDPGFEDDVLTKIRNLGVIDEAFVSYGTFDLVTKIRGATIEDLKELITHRIRPIERVRSTLTLILVEERPRFKPM